jgi:hypothetical protein
MHAPHNGQRVYLSGGMEYATNEGRDWRYELHEWFERELRCHVFNPNHESEKYFLSHHPGSNIRELKLTDISLYQQIIAELVEIDCREIATVSDFLVCYWDESAMRGAGTKGELTMAKYFGKPVYMVTSMPQHEIPGWVLACTTRIFTSFVELKAFLHGE